MMIERLVPIDRSMSREEKATRRKTRHRLYVAREIGLFFFMVYLVCGMAYAAHFTTFNVILGK